jgi:hypothetical protein
MDPRDVHKSVFATIFRTFISHTMQIGDCNVPATFQRIMTMIFRNYIGIFLHVYLDDLFVFSNSIEEHEKHLGLVFKKICEHKFYLQQEKCELYAERIDCLGHVVNKKGLHADSDKMAKICNWRQPQNYNDVQKFLGLVQYLAHFLPNITLYTGPLASMTQNGQPFYWRPIHQTCFQMIKNICCSTPVLVPIDPQNQEPIWVICNTLIYGVGVMYGQGETWQICRPAGFMSRKFTNAQRHYCVFEQETIAILEALLKWEDKLIGYRIHVVTNHKALKFFQTQRQLSSRQTRWMEYLLCFNFDISYIKGVLNKVADMLLRYYESNTWYDNHGPSKYVNADEWINNIEELPWDWLREIQDKVVEIQAIRELTQEEEKQHDTVRELIHKRD